MRDCYVIIRKRDGGLGDGGKCEHGVGVSGPVLLLAQ